MISVKGSFSIIFTFIILFGGCISVFERSLISSYLELSHPLISAVIVSQLVKAVEIKNLEKIENLLSPDCKQRTLIIEEIRTLFNAYESLSLKIEKEEIFHIENGMIFGKSCVEMEPLLSRKGEKVECVKFASKYRRISPKKLVGKEKELFSQEKVIIKIVFRYKLLGRKSSGEKLSPIRNGTQAIYLKQCEKGEEFTRWKIIHAISIRENSGLF